MDNHFKLLLLMLTGLFLAAQSLFAEVMAEVQTEKGYRQLMLIKIEEDTLIYRPRNVPKGVEASLALSEIKSANFKFEYDQAKVFEADSERNWVLAARIILEGTMATLPFLALPENNAIESVFQAGQFLERAAHAHERRGEEGDKKKALKLYKQADKILDAVSKAAWSYLSEPAALKAIGCKVALGNLEEAARELRNARIPEPYDGAYGQYWLAKGRLRLAQGDARGACNAVAKTVVFDNKNIAVFPDALLFFGRCHEEITEYHRARDLYYEVARLFTNTEWGHVAIERLEYIMKNGLTADKEKSNIAKVFFGVEEDMNAKSKELLKKIEEQKKKKD